MPRWLRVARGMIGTGLTFATAVFALGTVVGSVARLAGALSAHGMMVAVTRTTVASFIVGVVFSGVLALVARGRAFETLSLPFVTALGACGGMLYFMAIGITSGFRAWSLDTAAMNFVLLLAIGAGAAAGTLLVARKARHALHDAPPMASLNDATSAFAVAQRERERGSRL